MDFLNGTTEPDALFHKSTAVIICFWSNPVVNAAYSTLLSCIRKICFEKMCELFAGILDTHYSHKHTFQNTSVAVSLSFFLCMYMYLYPSFSSFLSASLFLSLFLHLSLSQVEVYSVKVACKVASRFAHTVITSSALNKAKSSQEVFFEVDLPKTAFITNFSMSVSTHGMCRSHVMSRNDNTNP